MFPHQRCTGFQSISSELFPTSVFSAVKSATNGILIREHCIHINVCAISTIKSIGFGQKGMLLSLKFIVC